MAKSLSDIYNFLGLCPFDRIPSGTVHETFHSIPSHHVTINSTSMAFLLDFFEPYNILLEVITTDDNVIDIYRNNRNKEIPDTPSKKIT